MVRYNLGAFRSSSSVTIAASSRASKGTESISVKPDHKVLIPSERSIVYSYTASDDVQLTTLADRNLTYVTRLVLGVSNDSLWHSP